MTKSESLFERAVKRIPGGVNSPVRAYGAIGEAPRFIERADGCYIYDVDGNKYVDYIDSWGPMILGHNFPAVRESVLKACEKGLSFGCATEIEVEMAEFICERIPHVEMVRMVNSGTEAVMSAIRTARGFTGRDKIIKFAGCYHGHSDALLVSAGSGVMTSGVPDSAGVPKGCTRDTMTAVYNDLDSVRALLEEAPEQVAAVIVEPVGANMGVVPPKKGFLEGLRTLCDQYGALLIFDEVATGFGRTGNRFVADLVLPDILVLGKALTGGYIGHAVTVANHKVFNAFYSDDDRLALMHGPTFMGNPLACAVALKGIEIFEREDYMSKIHHIEQISRQEMEQFTDPRVQEVRIMGGCTCVEVRDPKYLEGFQQFAYERGVFCRPFLNYMYSMVPYVIKDDELIKIFDVMKELNYVVVKAPVHREDVIVPDICGTGVDLVATKDL